MLAGIITRLELLKWAQFHLKIGIRDGQLPLSDILRLAHATKAKEIAKTGGGFSVKLDDSLAKAIGIMIDHDLVGIPVLDDSANILGDLRVSPVLAFSLRSRHGEQDA